MMCLRLRQQVDCTWHSFSKSDWKIKGRYTGNNTRLMFDFIDYAYCHDKQRTLLSLDVCKAFDSLKWEFIFKIFECYGFGDNFMRFLKTVYNTPKCCVINNNNHVSFFRSFNWCSTR